MSKKKKVTRGNPAAIVEPKTRGGWKPSTSIGNSPVVAKPVAKPVRKRTKPNWKKIFVLSTVVILAGVFVVTSVITTAPLFPEAPTPYNAPNVIQTP